MRKESSRKCNKVKVKWYALSCFRASYQRFDPAHVTVVSENLNCKKGWTTAQFVDLLTYDHLQVFDFLQFLYMVPLFYNLEPLSFFLFYFLFLDFFKKIYGLSLIKSISKNKNKNFNGGRRKLLFLFLFL